MSVFDARTVMEAEIWLILDLMAYTQRDSLSCVILTSEEEDTFADAEVFAKQIRFRIGSPERIRMKSFSSCSIRWMAWVSAFLISTVPLWED